MNFNDVMGMIPDEALLRNELYNDEIFEEAEEDISNHICNEVGPDYFNKVVEELFPEDV